MDEERIDVADSKISRRHTRPCLAAVSALEKAADFDSDVDDIGILRMKGDALHVCLMWRSGKSPFLHARHLAQGRQLGPALAKIIAIIQMRRLGARVHAWFSINRLAGEGVNLLIADAAVAPLPILAEISAGVNLCAIGAAEQHLATGLEDDRAEVLARNLRSLALPRTAAFLKRENAVDSAHEQFIFRHL